MEKHHWCCINFLKQCRLEILPPACKISRPPTLTSTRLQKGQFQWTKPLPVVKIVLYLNYCLYHSWLTHYHYDGVLAPPPEYTINTGARHLYLRSSILLLFIRQSSFTDFSLQKGTGDILKFILLSVSVNACYFSGRDWKESSVKLL